MSLKRVLLMIALVSGIAQAQTTTTITGTLKDLTNAVVTSGKVTFTLRPSADTTISGVARFSPQTITCLINGSGLIKALDGTSVCTLTMNTALQPPGSYYLVKVWPYNVATSTFTFYAVLATYDWSTVVPTPTTSPAANFVDVFSNQTIGGNKAFTGVATFSNPGVFTNGQYNLYGQFLVGGSIPSGETTPAYTAALIGGIVTPASATVLNSMGIVGLANSKCNSFSRTICNTVAGYFQARASINGASAWAQNGLVNDFTGVTGTYLTGNEIDVNVQGAPTQVYGLQITGILTGTMPANSFGILVNPVGGGKFNTGLSFADGSINSTAIFIPALAVSGNSIASAPIGWDFFDSVGAAHSVAQSVDASGLMNMAQGVRINGGAPTCTFTTGGGTSPSCTLDTGSTNQSGIIIATTGTGSPAGTGTITLTFTNFSNAFGPDRPVCNYMASDGGAGQWVGLAVMKDKTPSNTSDLFTWTNQPVATGANTIAVPTPLSTSTAYWITYQCWPK